LIESADTIYEIQRAAEGLASKLTFIKDQCAHVADTKQKSTELNEGMLIYRRIQHMTFYLALKQQQVRTQVANKIRTLIETPEQV